jgi:signal transduction histidine kinase
MSSYARLARLPAPRKRSVSVAQWVRRASALETRLQVCVEPGPELTIEADGDQLDQALINLVRNAVDASLETSGRVDVTWRAENGYVDVIVRDEGPGAGGATNLFVPFFTTKPDGSGIGLVLARQIAEGHGGMVTLENRPDGHGAVATLRVRA